MVRWAISVHILPHQNRKLYIKKGMTAIKNRSLFIILSHIILWVVLFAVVALFRRPENNLRELNGLRLLITALPYIALFYLHARIIIPRFMVTKNRAAYSLSVFTVLICTATFSACLVYPMLVSQKPFFQLVLGRILPGLFFLAASGGFAVLGENIRME